VAKAASAASLGNGRKVRPPRIPLGWEADGHPDFPADPPAWRLADLGSRPAVSLGAPQCTAIDVSIADTHAEAWLLPRRRNDLALLVHNVLEARWKTQGPGRRFRLPVQADIGLGVGLGFLHSHRPRGLLRKTSIWEWQELRKTGFRTSYRAHEGKRPPRRRGSHQSPSLAELTRKSKEPVLDAAASTISSARSGFPTRRVLFRGVCRPVATSPAFKVRTLRSQKGAIAQALERPIISTTRSIAC